MATTFLPSNKERIAIIGGGIGGVALAVGLRYRGIQVQVFEAGDDFTELGAGIALGPNAISALNLLDPAAGEVFEALATKNLFEDEKATWINFRHGMGKPSLIAKVQTQDARKTGLSSVHRAKFLTGLSALIPRDIVQFGKRLNSIEDKGNGEMHIFFEDGSSAVAEAVIGCDGVRSSVRQYVLGLQKPLDKVAYTHKYVYRGLVDMSTAKAALGDELACNSQMYLGPGGHILSYPIDGGETMNVVAFRDDNPEWNHPTWVVKARGDDMRREFEGWGEAVTKIAEMLKQPDKWALFNHEPASTFCKGSVVLLGDAAHATTPHQGAGAGQAIEDALTLSVLLERALTTGKSFAKTFSVYDAIRRPRSQRVVATSRAAGDTYAFTGPAGGDAVLLREELLHRYNWIWEHDM
ncbi:putative salicylate hydroxylase [Lojkania enalia]|uniref:Salicylate hydroxylase n=1 Tax=Lojkania enalia TaxID=147567 RepID=A0A9P4K164_9PLEO|nr:putative salicylate hydroxylase [Didymosphaeria enalia]